MSSDLGRTGRGMEIPRSRDRRIPQAGMEGGPPGTMMRTVESGSSKGQGILTFLWSNRSFAKKLSFHFSYTRKSRHASRSCSFYLLGKLSKMAPRISFFQAPILLIPRTGVPMSGGRKSFRIGNDWMRIGEKGKERGGRGRYLFQVGGGEERRKRSGYEKQRDWF